MIQHQYDGSGKHRVINHHGKSSDWASYDEIAKMGNICATTDYWDGYFPRVFAIIEIDPRMVETSSPAPKDD